MIRRGPIFPRRSIHDKRFNMSQGVGTELRDIFHWWGFRATKSCRCKTLRRRYDKNGPDWCQEHINEIVDQIIQEAAKRNVDWQHGVRHLLPSLPLILPEFLQRLALTQIVQICINRAKEKIKNDC